MNGKLFEIDKYDSQYPDARLYRCDKNFTPRLCAMVEKIYRNESGRIDAITEQIAIHAVDYLFSSEINIDESAPVDDVVDLREENALLKKEFEDLKAEYRFLVNAINSL